MNETTIPATKLRRDLGAVLDAVLGGRTVRVDRNGRPLAVIVPPAEYDRLMGNCEMTTTPRHFTAWLVNDTSMLDQPFMDVTILEDALIGDPDKPGSWATDSSKERVFYGITSVDAADGEAETAIAEAETMMRGAGWRTVGKWEALDSSYIVTVELEGDER